MKRRDFIACAAAAFLGNVSSSSARAPRILLRSSWQSVNIGDIAHTPGALRLLEQHFPQAELTLWPRRLGHGSRELLRKAFPRVEIAEGEIDADGRPTTQELSRAWSEADLFLHGSGPGFTARVDAAVWKTFTNKPYGIFGITRDPVSGFGGPGRRVEGGTLKELRAMIEQLPPGHLGAELRELLDGAAFVFCRDSLTETYFRRQGVKAPVLEFGTDATFALHLRDEARATACLRARGLEESRFICVVPRQRYTPYYSIYQKERTPDDHVKDAINARTTETDHAKLRNMIVAWVRETGLKVLACPEMTYQVKLAKESVVDPLPGDVRQNVVWRDTYWLPDEAASVYARATAVVSFECHSPIIALANGTPAFYVRQPTDTIKGQMYHDIGMSDWTFEVDQTSGEELWSRLKSIHADPTKARTRVQKLMDGVKRIQRRMVDAVKASV